MSKLSVLVADDHAVVRSGLRSLLEGEPDMTVVGEAADGESAVLAAGELRPDVVIMDVSMPRGGGVEAATRIRREWPEVRVVALTAHEEPGYLRKLLAAGATGYLLKRTAVEELVRAVRAVATGGTFLDPAVSAQVVQELGGRGSAPLNGDELSEREVEVLKLITAGYPNTQIATRLEISVKTVETYKGRAMEKLGIRSRVGLVQYAAQMGWLDGI